MIKIKQPDITILLASYNGQNYLAEQIDSILGQTYKNWKLVIRDDGSSDDTLEIIKTYSRRDGRITLLEDNIGNLRSSQNFSVLLGHHLDADYIMFSDQDDVWENNKIEVSIKLLLQKETIYGKEVPALVYSNFTYVDQNLNKISEKSNIFLSIKKQESYLPKLIAQNWIYGCTMIMNNKLAKLSYPVPLEAENHDYWISLVAAYCGNIFHNNISTLKYRQHSNNVSGSYNDKSPANRIRRILNGNNVAQLLITKKLALLGKLIQCPGGKSKFNLVNQFSIKCETGGIGCVWFCLYHGINKRGFLQSVMYYVYLLIRPFRK